MMIDGLVDTNGSIKAIRRLKLPNSVALLLYFIRSRRCLRRLSIEPRRVGSRMRPSLRLPGSKTWPSLR